jgi:c-di-GMP-binding flagellar brake protein YcgR
MQRIPHAAELVDRREAPRAEIAGQYSIRLNPGDGRSPVDCALIDYSVTGMRIELPGEIELPDEVLIQIGEIEHNARIVWRRGNMLGLDFLDEHHSIF